MFTAFSADKAGVYSMTHHLQNDAARRHETDERTESENANNQNNGYMVTSCSRQNLRKPYLDQSKDSTCFKKKSMY